MIATASLNNITEIRAIGLKALMEALGPVGMARFIQQYDAGYGDYTKEKYNFPDIAVEEMDNALRPLE